jgi:hypothetical protein
MTEPAKKGGNPYAWVYWTIGIVAGIVILAVVFSSDSGSGASSTSKAGGAYGGGNTPARAPTAVDFRPVCKALDEKNGFKDFRFGMTLNEARAVLEPTDVSHDPGAKVDVFQYSGTAVNRIGEIATDSVWLRFFDGQLYQVDVRLSGFGNEVFQALKISYGEPADNGSWTRGEEKLAAKSWDGEKVSAVILALPSQAWDAVVLYDQAASQRAREYADKEPERVAADFSTNGFKLLTMGMRLEDVTASYFVTEASEISQVKKVSFNRGDWFTVGFYPLQSVSAEFFQGRLYRMDLGFGDHRKELFQTVQRRFGPLSDNNAWTRGSEKLTAKSGGTDRFYCTILAPTGENWDYIVLQDYSIQREAEEFKSTRAKGAARNFSTNGFKSLALGMRLQDVNVQYTVTDSSDVTGVKSIVIRSGDLLVIGVYPLRYVSCEFFKDKLYQIDLEFNQNRQEIFQAFQQRFAPLQENDSWTQGTMKLTARSGGSDRCYGTILAPGGSYGGQEWETIVLLDGVLQREAAQYKEDAPKRAAKDL